MWWSGDLGEKIGAGILGQSISFVLPVRVGELVG